MNSIGKIERCLKIVAISLLSGGWAWAGDVKALESYPEADRLWMGLEDGNIRPASYEQIRATVGSYLKLHAADGEILKKGQRWAVQDPEQLDIEFRGLELERTRQKRALREAHHAKEEANARLRLELHETERSKEELLAASRNPELPEALRHRAVEAVAKVDEKISLLMEKMDPEDSEIELQIQREESELALERKEKQFEILKRTSELTAKFPGELRLSEAVAERLKEATDSEPLIWVESNELIATIADESSYEIAVLAASPLLGQIPREELLVFFQEGRTGKLIGGDYSRMEEIDNGAEIVRNYIFTIQAQSLEDARHSMGQRNFVHIYRKFDRKYRLIHKKDIAFLAPDVLASSGWEGLVRHLWPGSQIVQVGPQTIAVKPANEH